LAEAAVTVGLQASLHLALGLSRRNRQLAAEVAHLKSRLAAALAQGATHAEGEKGENRRRSGQGLPIILS
jgi:hypothetical protein